MTLIPVLPNVANPVFVGSWISNEDSPAPSWDYTDIPIAAGDLLIAIIATGAEPEGPAGFTPLVETTGAYKLGIYTKTATGSETTFANSITSSGVATIAVRASEIGDALASDSPPAITNGKGEMVFIIAASDSAITSLSLPSDYITLGSFGQTNDIQDNVNNIYFAYNPYAGENEDPGPWADASVFATFSAKGA